MLVLFLSIILLTYFSLNKTLSFGLTGDDWFTLYRYILDFPTFAAHFNLTNYINNHSNYNFADLIMGFIYRQFSFNPFPYYLISMIMRIITAISFFFAVSMATKDKLTGYVSAFLFTSMFVGIETTNWVFNMNTYLSITLFNLFIYLYIRKDSLNFFLKNLILGLFLGLSFIITPNRMHGLLFAIPFIALIKIEKINFYNLKYFFLRQCIFYFPIFGFRFLFRSTDDMEYSTIIIQSLTKTNFLNSILVNLSNSILPENLYRVIGISQGGKIVITIFIFLFTLILFYKHLKNDLYLSKFVLLCISLIFSFVIMPLLIFNPNMTMSSDHRYLIIPGAYMMVIYAAIFSVLWRSRKQILITFALIFIGIIFFSNFLSLKNYFNNLSNKGRLAIDSQRQFSYLISQVNRPNNGAPIVLLFIPDDIHYLYNAITFGLPYHMMLADKRMGLETQKAPFAVDNLRSLIDVLSSKDSSELKRYGYKPVKIPLENVFVFTLQNKVLANITPQARVELRKLIPSL